MYALVGRISPSLAWRPRIVRSPCAHDTDKVRVPMLQIRHQASMTNPPISAGNVYCVRWLSSTTQASQVRRVGKGKQGLLVWNRARRDCGERDVESILV